MARLPTYPGRKKREIRKAPMHPLFPKWEMKQILKFVPNELNSRKTPEEKAISIMRGILGSRNDILWLRGKAGIGLQNMNILMKSAWKINRTHVVEKRKITKKQANEFLNVVRDFYDNLSK